jgi:hypothetical protein
VAAHTDGVEKGWLNSVVLEGVCVRNVFHHGDARAAVCRVEVWVRVVFCWLG